MPVLIDGLQRETGFRVVFIVEAEDSAAERYFRQSFTGLPQVEHYQISQENRLRTDLGENAQPLTLLLDGDQVVRRAFMGSLLSRRNDLLSAAARLRLTLSSLAAAENRKSNQQVCLTTAERRRAASAQESDADWSPRR